MKRRRCSRFIYVIWGKDGNAYVGQTADLQRRHRIACLLDTIEVALELPDSTWLEAEHYEDRAIRALRARGIDVVNPTNAENDARNQQIRTSRPREWWLANARKARATWLSKTTHQERSTIAKKAWKARTPEERRQIGLRGAAAVSPEVRRERTRRGWITRRARQSA